MLRGMAGGWVGQALWSHLNMLTDEQNIPTHQAVESVEKDREEEVVEKIERQTNAISGYLSNNSIMG